VHYPTAAAAVDSGYGMETFLGIGAQFVDGHYKAHLCP
jgi:hypothetical protein